MSFGVHTTQSIATIILAFAEGEEVQTHVDSEMPDAQGEMKTGENNYTLCQQRTTTTTASQLHSYIRYTGQKNSIKLPDNSPMHLGKSTYQAQSNRGSMSRPTGRPTAQTSSLQMSFSNSPVIANRQAKSFQLQQTPTTSTKMATPQQTLTRSEAARTGERVAQTRGHERGESTSALQSHRWVKEDTVQWWEQRYHQKEREGQRQGKDHNGEQQQPKKKNKKKKGIEAIAATSTSISRPTREVYREGLDGEKVMRKPTLTKPRTGVFALYYILTKIGILSDGTSNFSYKKEIEIVDAETTTAHKKRLEELKVAIEKEQSAARWGVMSKFFSWMGSLIGIIAGTMLIATGVGAVAGAMMIAGGLIQITSQILELTGGWRKIAEKLPGDDPAQKRAVIAWMQIGIAVLCLIFSGVGTIWGGFSNFSETWQKAMMIGIGAVAMMGHGATTIGEGFTLFMFYDKMSEVRRYEKILAELKHRRRDLIEKVESGIDRLEQLFEDLARALEFEVELFKADQMVNR